jgi:hypothetical protein
MLNNCTNHTIKVYFDQGTKINKRQEKACNQSTRGITSKTEGQQAKQNYNKALWLDLPAPSLSKKDKI